MFYSKQNIIKDKSQASLYRTISGMLFIPAEPTLNPVLHHRISRSVLLKSNVYFNINPKKQFNHLFAAMYSTL